MKTIIETKNVTKKFKNQIAVDDVSIHIEEGTVYGFLGPNGSGKSTTMKMLLGLMKPTAGTVEVFQTPLLGNESKILADVGSLIEEPSFYPNLTGLENMEVIRQLLNLPKENVKKALSIVRLWDHRDKVVKNYSLGMKQRLGIALALVKFPKVLILDEPTNGLDPAGTHEIRELIKSLPKEYGMTVMISSHILSEIEQMATTVGILNKGKLIYEGEISELDVMTDAHIRVGQIDLASRVMDSIGAVPKYIKDNEFILPHLSDVQMTFLIRSLAENNIDIYHAYNEKQSLEKIFLTMTDGEQL